MKINNNNGVFTYLHHYHCGLIRNFDLSVVIRVRVSITVQPYDVVFDFPCQGILFFSDVLGTKDKAVPGDKV